MDNKKVAKELLRNGIDYLLNAIDELSVINSISEDAEKQRKYKYIFRDLISGVELTLKAYLCEKNWLYIVDKKIDDIDINKFEIGDLKTIDLEQGMSRITKLCNNDYFELYKVKFKSIKDHRNKVEHFYENYDDFVDSKNKNDIYSMIALTLLFAEDNKMGSKDSTFELLIIELNKKLSVLKAEIEEKIQNLNKDYPSFLSCPYCEHKTLVEKSRKTPRNRGEDLNDCLFCGYTASPLDCAHDYSSYILGITMRDIQDGGYDYITECPDCGYMTMIDDANNDFGFCYYCFLECGLCCCPECGNMEHEDCIDEDNGFCENCTQRIKYWLEMQADIAMEDARIEKTEDQ